MSLLEVTNLSKHYEGRLSLAQRLTGGRKTVVRAVNGVSLHVNKGEVLGLIGESGCGKSTLGRAILRLHEPTEGKVVFDGEDVTALSPPALKAIRRRMQIIFQDPYASLNPRRTVAEIVGLPLALHDIASGDEARAITTQVLQRVGLQPDQIDRYPHQFSGGQRQRIGIARALVSNPEFIVCDEPVSALDVSIQAQIIALLLELKQELGLTYLFISHDISVIGYLSDRVAVMYLGEIVETGPVASVLDNPRHPYTQSLLSAVPEIGAKRAKGRVRLQGDLPSPLNPPNGCKFHTRCPLAIPICQTVVPVSQTVGAEHFAACHRLEEGHTLLEETR
ncbi:ABC transporter ATP-binding protein [Pseudotabrizicola alkalilacus]|uniref:ATP-binding cassette domain-containing protein n=1 Tax=Pseudotabrizicola alkalilacus TaxID=2305252 RepID=A0A411YZW4_9RHOB|nr:oligopeptide/dipeptide ABC transporter ATP-binding protein [Pseudotabrizicola alkalilacus]RGP36363.1 ATP-binding cassette domain-containing protein [Pseudotabrizicola alkalilacus]